MQPTRAATESVRGWVRSALALESGTQDPVPGAGDAELADSAVGDVVAAVARQRVVELLEARAADLGLDPRVRDALTALRRHRRRQLLVQQLETARAQGALLDAGVPCLAFKGVALAVQTAGDPTARGLGDVDLLVDPQDVARAHAVLGDHGWLPAVTGTPDVDSWAWRHVLWSCNELKYVDAAIEVDLHWRLDPTLDGLPAFSELWSRRASVELADGPVWTLAPRDALALSCYDAAKDDCRWLRNLVDVHRLARTPEVWAGDDLRRLERSSLAVTRTLVGLPDSVPDRVHRSLDVVPRRVVVRAERAQARAAGGEERAPGVESGRHARHLLAASRSARDLWHTLAATVLPVESVRDVEARSAWAGVPAALGRRVAHSLRRAAGWWSGRSHAAGVVPRGPR